MANETNLEIVIYQKRVDPGGAPEAAGSFWINLTSGAFFVSREVTNAGETSLEWFKEGAVAENQFRQLFDNYAPLATADKLRAGGVQTRVSITPALLRTAIMAIANSIANATMPLLLFFKFFHSLL